MSTLTPKALLARLDTLLLQVEEFLISMREVRPALEALVADEDDRDDDADEGDDAPAGDDPDQPLVKRLERLLRRHGPMSRRALANATGADPQTVREALGTAKAMLNEVDLTWRYTGKDA